MRAERRLLAHAGALAALLAGWEALAAFGGLDPFYFGRPSAVAAALGRLVTDPGFARHAQVSARNLLLGYGLGVSLGGLLGAVVGSRAGLYANLRGYARLAYAVPQLVLIPFLIVWLGIGDLAKTAVIALMTFFPVFLAAMEAARSVERELVDVCAVYGAGRWVRLTSLTLPSCAAAVLSGARISVARAVAGMILGETFGRAEGVGYLLFHHGALYAVNDMLAVLCVLLTLSVGLFMAMDALESRLVRWER